MSLCADSAISMIFEGFIKISVKLFVNYRRTFKLYAAVTLIYDVAIHTRYRMPVATHFYIESALREFYHLFFSSLAPLNVGALRDLI